MPTAELDEIVAENLGPIASLKLPVPAGGGVVVITGANGAGKSALIDAVGAMTGGKAHVTKRDGSLEGRLEGFGVTLKLKGRVTKSGELEAESLEGRLSIAELVDPQIDNPAAADARRIKALVALSGAAPSPALFYELCGGREAFDSLTHANESDDLVSMAARVKRDLEQVARTHEAQEANARSRADVARKSAEGVDVDQPHDAPALQAELEAAIAEKSRIEAEAKARQEAIEAARLAAGCLEDAEAEYQGPTVEAARQHQEIRERELLARQAEVESAKSELARACERMTRATFDRDQAADALRAAEDHGRLVAQWRAQVEAAANIQPIVPELIEAARVGVSNRRICVEQAALVRQARMQLDMAKKASEEAKAHHEQAERLRNAAKATDDVLSAQVARVNCPLKVATVDEKARLVLTTGRGQTYFGDLSHGERWRIALDVAIAAVGPRGLIPVPQEAWESLAFSNQEAIAEQARAAGVWIITARASRKGEPEEIGASVFEG